SRRRAAFRTLAPGGRGRPRRSRRLRSPVSASNPEYAVLGDEPIQTTTIKDEVYRRLKSVIIEGDLRPGQRLIEGKLAVTLNVSRTPLREAIQVLVQERFLER